MKKENKTNAMRILDKEKIPYEPFYYDCEEFIDGVHIADMLGQRLVGFLVPSHLLALSATHHTTGDIGSIVPVHREELLSDAYVLDVDGVEIALAEREVVNGIKQIRLSRTVVAHKAIYIAT